MPLYAHTLHMRRAAKTNQLWCARASMTICSAVDDDDDDDDEDVSAWLQRPRQRYSATTVCPRRQPRDDVIDVVNTSPSTVKRYWPDRSRHVTPSSQSGNLQDGDGQLTKSAIWSDYTFARVNKSTILKHFKIVSCKGYCFIRTKDVLVHVHIIDVYKDDIVSTFHEVKSITERLSEEAQILQRDRVTR